MLCVLIVKGMSVVVNVMLSLMSVMSPPPALCNLSVRTDVKLCIFLCFGFRGELGFLNCDDVCMCVVNKQFELLEFVSESVCSMMRFVVVPYVVRAVVAVTVMHVLLFVLHVCVL